MAADAKKTTLRWITTDSKIEKIEQKTLSEVYELFADFAKGDDDILQSLIATLMALMSARITMSFPDDLCQIQIALDSSYPDFETILEKAYEIA